MFLSEGCRTDQSKGLAISIVLGSYNRKRFLKTAIESIRNNEITLPYEIIVVDGGSTDGSLRWLLRQKDTISIVQHNRGTFRGKQIPRRNWGYFMNLGFKCAQGKYILMISDDCLLVPGSVMNGYNHFEKLLHAGRSIGAVAFYWRNWPEQQDYWVGLTWGNRMFVNHGMYLRDALQAVGWIDEERYKFYHADGDLCLKLWEKGYETVDCCDAFVEHFQHANAAVRKSNLDTQPRDWQTYASRWSGVFENDRNGSGGWVYHQFSDASGTARLFPKYDASLLRFRVGMQRVRRQISHIRSRVKRAGLPRRFFAFLSKSGK
jgi:glycosyltransferase involved in cell wall biosynthesis